MLVVGLGDVAGKRRIGRVFVLLLLVIHPRDVARA